MFQILVKQWWIYALRGVVSLAFAAAILVVRQFSFETLALLVGVLMLADGLPAIYGGLGLRGQDDDWWVAALEGLLGVGLGAAIALASDLSADRLLLYLSLWCLLTGAFEIILAYRIRKEIRNEWLLALAGALSMVLGLIIMFLPNAANVPTAWWLSGYALFFGLLMLGLGFRLRGRALPA